MIYFSSPIDGVAVLTDTLGAMAAIIIERERDTSSGLMSGQQGPTIPFPQQ